MKAVVVYDSLWGNTQAIAEEVAAGLGAGARALTTTEATPAVLSTADVVVAGSPVHGLSLPNARSKKTGRIQGEQPGHLDADVSLTNMAEWLTWLPRASGYAAAFDTRVKGPFGRGGSSKIDKGLRRAGYRMLAAPEGFLVDGVPPSGERGSLLRNGERERAREWGRALAREYAKAQADAV